MNEIVKENTSGAIAVTATPVGGKSMMQKRNPDGTAKNALDMKNSIFGENPIRR